MIGVELCAGTLCVGLSALAGRLVDPITSFMGSKRRWRRELAELAYGWGEIDELVAVDAGPWGDVWRTLGPLGLRAEVEQILREEAQRGLLSERWPVLAEQPPFDDPAERAAQYICLQARSASCIPVWWCSRTERWVAPTGSRTWSAHQKGGRAATQKGRKANSRDRKTRAQCQVDRAIECSGARRPSQPNGSGLQHIGTLADRVAALAYVPLDRLHVVHGRVEDFEPVAGSRTLFDPPYFASPRYAEVLPRDQVLEVARRHAELADRVCVCEGEPLPLDGWKSWRLTGERDNWITFCGSARIRQPPLQMAICEAVQI